MNAVTPLSAPRLEQPDGSPPGAPRRSRRRIVSAARELFLGRSYADVSTDLIAGTAGVSKSTLYAHFRSKEDLFAEIMECEIAALGARVGRCGASRGDMQAKLARIARSCLDLLLSPEATALHRIAVAEAPKFPEMGRRFHELGPKPLVRAVAAVLKRGQASGYLRTSDPEIAALHFLALIQGDLVLRGSLALARPGRE